MGRFCFDPGCGRRALLRPDIPLPVHASLRSQTLRVCSLRSSHTACGLTILATGRPVHTPDRASACRFVVSAIESVLLRPDIPLPVHVSLRSQTLRVCSLRSSHTACGLTNLATGRPVHTPNRASACRFVVSAIESALLRPDIPLPVHASLRSQTLRVCSLRSSHTARGLNALATNIPDHPPDRASAGRFRWERDRVCPAAAGHPIVRARFAQVTDPPGMLPSLIAHGLWADHPHDGPSGPHPGSGIRLSFCCERDRVCPAAAGHPVARARFAQVTDPPGMLPSLIAHGLWADQPRDGPSGPHPGSGIRWSVSL